MVTAAALIGRKVLTSDDYFLGQVHGVEIEAGNWRVTYVKVRLSRRAVKDLHLDPPMFMDVVFSLPVSLVKELDETVTLNVPLSASWAAICAKANTSQPLSAFDLSDIEEEA